MVGNISINEQKTASFYLEMSERRPLNELFDPLYMETQGKVTDS
jgi:hypothetical protein